MTEEKQKLNFSIQLRGYREDEYANRIGNVLAEIIQILAQHINLTSLTGVSVGYDYYAELNSVDRGVETTVPLVPSNGDVIGVAMVVRVIRDGQPRSHIVFNALYLEGLIEDIKSENFQRALGIVAHECAHVSNMAALAHCFPGLVMSYRYENVHDALRGECWLSVMEEYCATRIAAGIGFDNGNEYKTSFLRQVDKLSDAVKKFIEKYRNHRDVDKVLHEVYEEIVLTLKLSAYYLGDKAGKGNGVFDFSDIAPSNQWFVPFYTRLNQELENIFEKYGVWKSVEEMEGISDILDEMAVHLGLSVSLTPSGVYVHIP